MDEATDLSVELINMARMTTAMKQCCTCQETKPLSEFNKRASSHDGLQSRCRECCRAWYEKNRVQHIANVAVRNRRLRQELREFVAAYLTAHPCTDCGETDLRVLDFDHVDPSRKTLEISKMILNLATWEAIKAELNKCVVRCANCHRRRTFESRSWWRHRWMVDNGLLPPTPPAAAAD